VSFISSTTEMRSNFRRLYAEIFWYGVLSGSSLAFITIYAARLGATGFQISLFTAGPAIVNLLFSMPAANWLHGRGLIRVSYETAALARLGYLVLVFLPWLFSGRALILALVGVTFLISVPGTIMVISFNSLFAEVVEPDWRGEIVGKRNAILAVSMTITTLLCGQLLDRIPTPLNYQVVFAVGALGAALSTYNLGRLRTVSRALPQPQDQSGVPTHTARLPAGKPSRLPGWMHPSSLSSIKASVRTDLLRGPFGLFMAAYLVFYTFQYFTIPLYPLAYVHQMNLTDGQYSVGSGIFYGTMMLVSLRLRRLSARYGHRRILYSSAMLFALYPLLIGLGHDATLYWVASFFGGAAYALVTAGLINRLMERVPEGERPAHMALHNLALNMGILIGSLSGPLFSQLIGLQSTLILASGLRALAGVVFLFWG